MREGVAWLPDPVGQHLEPQPRNHSVTAVCVCMLDDRWRCGLHGQITPAMRAAARYGRHHGAEAQARQAELAAAYHACCGQPHEDGHHFACSNYKPQSDAEIHPQQETLL